MSLHAILLKIDGKIASPPGLLPRPSPSRKGSLSRPAREFIQLSRDSWSSRDLNVIA
jgi:hypothetical protein